MDEALKKLKNIGAQKIHEQTHIAKKHIKELLDGKFESFGKVQFLGFISILEREYSIDLSNLKLEGLKYFNDLETEQTSIFIAPQKRKNYKPVYIFIAIVIFTAAILYSMFEAPTYTDKIYQPQEIILPNQEKTTKNHQKDKSTSKKDLKTKNKSNIKSDTNTTNITAIPAKTQQANTANDANTTNREQNTTVAKKQQLKKEKPTLKIKEIIIRTKKRVWMGYIDPKLHKKKQLRLKRIIKLDAHKKWLLVFGHSDISIQIGKKNIKYKGKKSLRLLYENYKLTKLSAKEFKKLNKGKIW